jgi:predicted dithiol-disulfide oxidoreductase (DUF899 family)
VNRLAIKVVEDHNAAERASSSPRAHWLVARKDLLKREKELTHLRDQLSAERRALPWVKIDKEYIFDAPEGKVTKFSSPEESVQRLFSYYHY